jgi:hypothetical protein
LCNNNGNNITTTALKAILNNASNGKNAALARKRIVTSKQISFNGRMANEKIQVI